jgi:hypothetical protein
MKQAAPVSQRKCGCVRCLLLLSDGGHDIVVLPGGVSPQLVVDAPEDELPLGHGEPGDDVDWSEGRQLDVLVVRRRRRWWLLGVLHLIVGCVLCVGRSPLVAANNTTLQSLTIS